jgi:hypothetical protein
VNLKLRARCDLNKTQLKKKTMKKLLGLLISITSITSAAQLHIIEDCTDLSGKCYIFPSENLIVANSSKTKGFSIAPSMERNSEGKVAIDGLMVTMVGIGTCCENNELIFLFADSTKMTLTSWNDWNCEGNAWYNLSDKQVTELSTKPIIKAQMKNGYSFESFVNAIVADKQKYFITICAQVAANKVTLNK